MKRYLVDTNIAIYYRNGKFDLNKKAGTPVDDFDLLIGVTAVTHSLTMVTNNINHFKLITEIDVEDWAR